MTISTGQAQGTIQNDDGALLVISQVYPGGGANTGAPYNADFVELFNRSNNVSRHHCGLRSSVGNHGRGKFALDELHDRGERVRRGRIIVASIGAAGPLVQSVRQRPAARAPLLTGFNAPHLTCPRLEKLRWWQERHFLPAIVPAARGPRLSNPVSGWCCRLRWLRQQCGTGVNCYEGTGPASFTLSSNTTADFRKAGGCTDTNDNASDFLVSGPFPRNSASPANNCAGGATPNLTINDVTVAEGNSGTSTATFTVSLSAPVQGADVTFDIATQNNTALSGSDYVARTLTNQVIPAGVTTYTFDVTINGDTTIEPDETFFVNVTNASGANDHRWSGDWNHPERRPAGALDQ